MPPREDSWTSGCATVLAFWVVVLIAAAVVTAVEVLF